MATTAAAAVLAAAIGANGPRAQFFALRQPGALPAARAVAAIAARRRGLAGGILGLEDLLGLGQLASAIAPNLPAIEAASGSKSAKEFEAVQQQIALAQAQAPAATAQAQSNAVLYGALGLGSLGVALAIGLALSARGPAPSVRGNRRRSSDALVARARRLARRAA